MAKPGERWTPEEEEKLKSLYEAKYTLSVIAQRMGRSVRGISMRLEKLGLPVNHYLLSKELYRRSGEPWSHEEEQKAKVLYRHGITTNEISIILERSSNAIWQKLVELRVIDPLKK